MFAHTCHHLSDNQAGPSDIKSAEKWALALSSSTSQPSHIELQEQCPPPPLLFEKRQNGGSTSQNLVSREAQHIPRWSLLAPNSSLDLYPGKEKASTLMRTACMAEATSTTGQKTVVSNQKWAKLCLPALRNGNLPTTGTRVRRLRLRNPFQKLHLLRTRKLCHSLPVSLKGWQDYLQVPK